MMRGSFKIIVPSFNSPLYLANALNSVEQQKDCPPFDVCVIDDGSTLPEHKKIVQQCCQKNGWEAIFHSTNQGSLVSLKDGIEKLNCQDEDVIVVLDGDDWFANAHAIATLTKVYEDPKIFLTYGSFESFPPKCLNITYASPISEQVIERQLYRTLPWVFQHPRTFKYHLWGHIRDEDLRDEKGQYYRITGDRAFFYPLLELAGHHIKFIEEIIYIYNLANPLNDHKIDREGQLKAERRIKQSPKYQPL